jgi:hypothetical protein
VKDVAADPEWLNCPCFCGGSFCQYVVPLKREPACFRDATIPYCCGKPKLESAEDEAIKWSKEHTAKNEITITIHYRHLIDKKTKTCKLIIKPSDNEDVDAIYTQGRKFVSLLSSHRMQLGGNFKEYKAHTRSAISTDQILEEKNGDKNRFYTISGVASYFGTNA